ncbi:MAG: 16S rRNA (cytosine(967)-C(5))-methyltransferase RsmB [Desulfuromonas sp.]|nr:MAG: 16S rRNA (cytosine(967)-C(5))-methyltransferase RsmB [Desulfuromonas sp.]
MTFDPRSQALEILLRVERGGYADRSLDEALRGHPAIDPRDRGLCTELVYGVLRWRGRLDFALARFCKQPLSRLENRVLQLLRLGAYQILCLDRVPDAAAVDTSVRLARRLGLERATGFINGVLRAMVRGQQQVEWPAPDRQPLAYLQHELSLPEWLAKRWHNELDHESFDLARALLEPAPFTLRTNTLKISRTDLLNALENSGHQAEPTGFAPEGIVITRRGPAALPGDSEGLYQVQDEASMLIGHLVAPRPGERIVDCCAAPGGKTTHLAALADNRAEIVAVDLHPHRLALIGQGAKRLGCQGITAKCWDMSRLPDFLSEASFDAVLVDAPCSGLGVLRRNPEARWRLQPGDIIDLSQRQLAILDHASRLVRPGGRLVYSVCTTTTEETTEIVDQFLSRNVQFFRRSFADKVPASWQQILDSQGALRSFPHRHKIDGFFAVSLTRKG